MDDMRTKLLNFLDTLINKIVFSPSYNGNVDMFITNNNNLSSFISNNTQIITNPALREALLKCLNDTDYQNIINNISARVNNNSQQEIKIDKIIPAQNENVEFKNLTEISRSTLSEEEQSLYDKAIHVAMDYNGNHNVKIGYKDNHIIPIIQDEVGKITNLNEIDDTFTTEGIASRGFSDSLILAFIIGSVIGIIFLNIYSKFIK